MDSDLQSISRIEHYPLHANLEIYSSLWAIPIKAGAENIGFLIPVDILADNLRQMLMPEKLRRVRSGLVVVRIKTIGGQAGVSENLSERVFLLEVFMVLPPQKK